MVNRRRPVAAEYVVGGVSILPNVSVNIRFDGIKSGLFPS
jgi:hypothetical protein